MADPSPESARLAAAVAYTADAHAAQFRKRGPGDPRQPIPYISHLLGVAGLVSEDLGSPDEVIAALLHDVLEDQDPDKTRGPQIEQAFGPRVLAIVQGCSGPKSEEIPDYRERKQRYLDHLVAERDAGIIRVSLADKVHNSRSTVNDLESEGTSVWDRFNAGFDDQMWWYGSLHSAFVAHSEAGRASPARVNELGHLVERMVELGRPAPSRPLVAKSDIE